MRIWRHNPALNRESRKRYAEFVSKGIVEGRRPDLTGGGLLRTMGGWKGLKDLRDSGERVSADERILGGSEFVERVLRESAEEWEKKSLLRRRGMNLAQLLARVARHFGVDAEELTSGSKVPRATKARSVLCYLGVRKLGLTSAHVSRELGISPSAVSKAIVRAKEGWMSDIELLESQ